MLFFLSAAPPQSESFSLAGKLHYIDVEKKKMGGNPKIIMMWRDWDLDLRRGQLLNVVEPQPVGRPREKLRESLRIRCSSARSLLEDNYR